MNKFCLHPNAYKHSDDTRWYCNDCGKWLYPYDFEDGQYPTLISDQEKSEMLVRMMNENLKKEGRLN